MYLKEVHIKNFRSIKECKVSLDDFTVFIGENNAGKTTILDAIRIGLNKAINRHSFDEYDLNICETKNYYFNGTIIDKNNLPKEWLNEKLLNKDVRKLVYINENFCVPFNDETDKILHITNL